MIEKGKINIHTENIFPIIKKAVYSDHEIFLRELVSNSVDAINKRRMAALAGDCIEGDKGNINIKINRENKSITISDNGIGMTLEEVKKYINQVAFSSAQEFLDKYQKEGEQIIGHFGLGFYSSFMVSKEVHLITKSAKLDSKAIKWTCDGSPNFSIEETEREEPGTDVILFLLEEETEYLEPSRIKTLITKYCDFMPIEVNLESEVINKSQPIWKKSPRELEDKDYVDFYKYLYPYQGDPLFWIHLNTDFPYSLQGILYFPKITGRADWESGDIKLYCNQVFVSDSIKEVVPQYLLPLRGVIDSPDIPLNVSRSALQTDRKVRSIGTFISKKIADKLKQMKKENTEFYTDAWDSVGPFIKLGAMEDDKFSNLVEDLIIFPTVRNKDTTEDSENHNLLINKDKEYTTVNSHISRFKDESQKQILYCTDEISQSNALNLWKSQNKEVLIADSFIDTQFIPWLETKFDKYNFVRVDSDLDQITKDDTDILSNKEGEKESGEIVTFVKTVLNNEKITVQVKSLMGDNNPAALILLPEQMRRINDIGALMEQKLPTLPDYHVLLINQEHPIVVSIMKLKASSIILEKGKDSPTEKIAKDLVKNLYEMALLSVGGLEPKEISGFQARTTKLIENLIKRGITN